jgi:hypothetical protein
LQFNIALRGFVLCAKGACASGAKENIRLETQFVFGIIKIYRRGSLAPVR